MADKGYFLKIAGQVLENKYCCSYKVVPQRRTDKDSYVDGNGKLNRKILPHKRSTITFLTGFLVDDDLDALMGIFCNVDKATVEYWNPKHKAYDTGTFYLPDIEFEMLPGREHTYRPLQIEMIEY
ncbi:MAG: hypothetical protein K2O03_08395 [Lachnospiraceae bacterium]|nr:hypothetical protein [Lachnospiraceae bacterium]